MPRWRTPRFGSRSAHIEADEFAEAEEVGDRLRGDDTCRRARLQHLNALLARRSDVAEAATRLHDQ